MAAGPVAEDSRIELVDALRGFALAGVLFINLRLFTQFDLLSDAQRAALPTAGLDEILLVLAQAFGDGKFISLFSMLFGYGFALQIQRLESRGAPAAGLFFRRLGALALIGIAHSLLWWGDILRHYALMGVLLLVTRKWPARRLAWAGVILAAGFIVVPTTMSIGPETAANQRALEAFSSPSVLVSFRGNVAYDWYQFLKYPWLFAFILSRFFLGSAAGKAGWLADPRAHRSAMAWTSIAGLVVGLIGTVLIGAVEGTTNPWFVEDAPGWNLLIGLNTAGLAVAYGCWFALLFVKRIPHALLRHLAPVGRMCLSNYLSQSIVCVLVFYGVGLGIGPRYGMTGVYVTWAILFGAQMIVSPLWLSRFQFGPAEWVWRSLTYGAMQPLRR